MKNGIFPICLVFFMLVVLSSNSFCADNQALTCVREAAKYAREAYDYARKASLEETREISRNFARKAMLAAQNALQAAKDAEDAVKNDSKSNDSAINPDTNTSQSDPDN